MSRIVYFMPLDGIGEAPVDLDACPLRFSVESQDRDHPDFPDEAGTNRTIYQIGDGRWVEHIVCYREFFGWTKRFVEVNPKYVAETLVEVGLKLPLELVPHWEALEAERRADWPRVPNPFEPIAKITPGRGRTTGRPRDRGLANKCVGIYLESWQNGEPLTVTEVAARAHCSEATASRAIKPLMEKHEAMKKPAANDRRRKPMPFRPDND
jgi:hypothetical protein